MSAARELVHGLASSCMIAAVFVAAYSPPVKSEAPAQTGSVIFIHPDGTSAAHWTAVRLLYTGPDGHLNWDRLPHLAVYRGHMIDRATATSNGGATVHAYGIKASQGAYGVQRSASGTGAGASPAGGEPISIMRRALDQGLRAGTVNSGTMVEPGTGCFLAAVAKRSDHAEIVRQLVASGAHVIFGGGEEWFLPEGVPGRHVASGRRTDGLDCVKEAERLGYTVIYTRDELRRLPPGTDKVLGLFAGADTYNGLTEEVLAERGLPPYNPEAPTVAEMTEAALSVLDRPGNRFLLVVEEEGTDNFGNSNNARDCLLALHRADEAIGVARRFRERRPDTLILTAADSDAGGLEVVGLVGSTDPNAPLAERSSNGAPQDGRDGTATPPFLTAPDASGKRWPFAVAWASPGDMTGGVVARAEGLNARWLQIGVPPDRSVAPEGLAGAIDNTGIHSLMYYTLFGSWPKSAALPGETRP